MSDTATSTAVEEAGHGRLETPSHREAMLEKIAALHAEQAKAIAGGGEKSVARHHARGKLLPRERIELLIDEGTAFLELSPLAAWGSDFPVGASVVTGIGVVEGVEVMISANDPSVKGGASNPWTVKKIFRAAQIAQENGLPTVSLVESGGADLPTQKEIFIPGGKLFRDLTRASARKEPTIALVFGNSTAGGAYVPGMSDYTVMVKEQAKVFLGGPPLVKMATGEESDDESLGGAEMHARVSGLADYLAEDERDAIRIGRRIIARLNRERRASAVEEVALQPSRDPGRGSDAPGLETGLRPSSTSGGPRGHAIEVRLYAEDPAADYQPQSGVLTTFEVPDEPGVRVDGGFVSGSEVSTFYDAMLAKVMVHAPTREQACRQLAGVLRRTRIHGLVTNRDQLVAILSDPDFVAGRVSTAFLTGWAPPTRESDPDAPLAAAIAIAETQRAARTVQQRIPVAFRNVPSQPQRTEFEGELVAEWWGGRDGYTAAGVRVLAAAPGSVVLERDGVATTYACRVTGLPGRETVDVDAPSGYRRLVRVPRFLDPSEQVASGSLLAPMPGSVVKVLVEQGQQVAAGDPVLVLEAMKMQHTVSAPSDGVVSRLEVAPGTQVAAGEVMAVVEENPGG